MRRRSFYKGASGIAALVLGLLLTSPGYAQDIRLQKAVIGSGGGTSSNGTMTMSYTVGQAATGTATDGTTRGTFGFWTGAALISSVEDVDEVGGVTLANISPNPVIDDEGTIELLIARAGEIEVTLYNALGENAGTLYSGTAEAGSIVITFGTADLAAGIYHIAVRVPGGMIQRPVSVIK